MYSQTTRRVYNVVLCFQSVERCHSHETSPKFTKAYTFVILQAIAELASQLLSFHYFF